MTPEDLQGFSYLTRRPEKLYCIRMSEILILFENNTLFVKQHVT
jgi:hypothetical protein